MCWFYQVMIKVESLLMVIDIYFGDTVLVEEAVELKELVKHAGALVGVDGVLGFNFFDIEDHFVLLLFLEVTAGNS